MQWLRDWWRGFSDADLARVKGWRYAEIPPPSGMTDGEFWALMHLRSR